MAYIKNPIVVIGGEYNIEVVLEEDGTQTLNITDRNYVPQPKFDRVFGNNTPAQIKAIGDVISAENLSEAEILERYGWAVGDTIDITMKTGEVVPHRIIDFNHDTITGTTRTAGITLDMVDCLATRYPMNSTNTNLGGWAGSEFRNTTLPTLLANYPDEWQEIFVAVDKKSANGGGTNYTETVITSDKLFLKSEIEVFGSVTYAQDGANEGTQYEYWQGKSAADRIKKYDTDADGTPDTVITWWERSSLAGSAYYFCYVGTSGDTSGSSASGSRGISLTFNVGGQPTPTPSYDRTFGNNSWADIASASAEISAQNMTAEQVATTYGWNLGDVKQETLTTGEVIELQIIGFNHDDKSDGTGKAGMTLQMVNCLATMYSMNTEDTNAGGWETSTFRTSDVPAIKATLSEELRAVIKLVDKKSMNVLAGNYAGTVTTSDEIFLLSDTEISGANDTLVDTQYEYWRGKSDADRIKKYDTDADGTPDTTIDWWLRSLYFGIEGVNFNIVQYNGNYLAAMDARGSGSISFAICI